MAKSILKDKSYFFAIKIVKLCQQLRETKNEIVLSKQILRSGTAIGALINEGEFAQSKAVFINKMSMALKEANETSYWLSLLKDTGYINENIYVECSQENNDLIAMLVSSVKPAKGYRK